VPESLSAAPGGGTEAPVGDGGELAGQLNLPLDALLDWGTDPTEAGKELEAQAEEALVAAERDEYLDSLRRLQADFDNFRKRSLRQQTELSDRATEGLCVRLLPVLDALDLATAHVRSQAEQGDAAIALEQIDSLLRDILGREGIERIDAVGVAFDPTIHDAVGQVPAEPAAADLADSPSPGDTPKPARPAKATKAAKAAAQGGGPTVAMVMRAGYRMKSKVLRPAMVLVGG
jgi:molecular chaperone GrpE